MKFSAGMKFLSAAFIALAIAGCATQRANWQARVGNYTYDQAVSDYGPPEKTARLENGGTVADWLIRRGHTVVEPQPYLISPGGFEPAQPAYNQTASNYYMRLTFGPDGKLRQYKNFYQ